MSAIVLRERSGPELIDAAIQMLRRYYPKLVTLTAVAMLPYIILRVVLPVDRSVGLVLLLLLVAVICSSIAEGSIVLAVSESYLEGRADIAAALSRTSRRLPAIIGATLVKSVYMGLGALLFIIPGIYCFASAFAVPAVTVLEGLGPIKSLSRSRSLSKGHIWKILGVLTVVWLIYFALYFTLALSVGATLSMETMTTNTRLLEVLTAILSVFVYPIIGVVVTLLYYDMRIRKEGFEISMMMRDLGLENAGSGMREAAGERS